MELITLENTSEYEKEVLLLLFRTFKNDNIISFDEINNIFLNNNVVTNLIFTRIKSLKRKIEKKLFDDGVYSKLGEKILKTINSISLVLFIDIIYLVYIIVFQQQIEEGFIILSAIAGIITAIIRNLNEITRSKITKGVEDNISRNSLKYNYSKKSLFLLCRNNYRRINIRI